jgi:Polypeptide deformylase
MMAPGEELTCVTCRAVTPSRRSAVLASYLGWTVDAFARARRVVVFDEDLCSLATDLLDTLRAASAIGITATHIGVLKRLAVIELAAADGVRT